MTKLPIARGKIRARAPNDGQNGPSSQFPKLGQTACPGNRPSKQGQGPPEPSVPETHRYAAVYQR